MPECLLCWIPQGQSTSGPKQALVTGCKAQPEEAAIPFDFKNAVETTREDLVKFGAAPGGYIFECQDCTKSGIGAKRSRRCEPCAIIRLGKWSEEESLH